MYSWDNRTRDVRQIGICRGASRGTPQGRTLFARKNKRLTYIKPYRAEIIRLRVMRKLAAIYFVGVGDSTTL